VLRAFVHRGLLAPEVPGNMRAWEGGGRFPEGQGDGASAAKDSGSLYSAYSGVKRRYAELASTAAGSSGWLVRRRSGWKFC
jgi:hypothetical protein